MILYPAIDLMQGQVVRLIKGDFAQKTVFPSHPVELVQGFANAGAKYLHLVDLSGARNPADRQLQLLSEVIKSTALKVQVGGGIRHLSEIAQLLNIGVDRVVIGSLFVAQPQVAVQALQQFGPEHLTFAMDVRMQGDQPMVQTHGWQQSSSKTLNEVLHFFLEHGLQRILCTDVEVDGRMVGPNLNLYRQLRQQFPLLQIQASGGIANLQDIANLQELQLHSTVIGRALLSGAFTFTQALQHVK